MIYDFSIDNIIVRELRADSRHTGRLLTIINKTRIGEGKKPITFRTLGHHLDKLEEQKIIGRNPAQLAGHKRYSCILEDREVEIRLGLELVSTKRNEGQSIRDTRQKRVTRALILLLYIAAFGSIQTKTVSKAEPGDFEDISRITGKPETIRLYTLSGVSAEDIANHEILDYSKRFSYTGLSEQEIRQQIETLEDLGILNVAHQTKGKTYYKVVDERWGDFVVHCNILLQAVIMRMELTWAYIRNPHSFHDREEIRWYYEIVGEVQAKKFLLDDRYKMNNNKLNWIRRVLGDSFKDNENLFRKTVTEINKARIRVQDCMIESQFSEIENQYQTVLKSGLHENSTKANYELIFRLMRKIIFPSSYRKMQKNRRWNIFRKLGKLKPMPQSLPYFLIKREIEKYRAVSIVYNVVINGKYVKYCNQDYLEFVT